MLAEKNRVFTAKTPSRLFKVETLTFVYSGHSHSLLFTMETICPEHVGGRGREGG